MSAPDIELERPAFELTFGKRFNYATDDEGGYLDYRTADCFDGWLAAKRDLAKNDGEGG